MQSFEREVRHLLDRKFPCCALSSTPIFRADCAEDREKGYEIDHLLHVRTELGDCRTSLKRSQVWGEAPGWCGVAKTEGTFN
jgi:hypothetical protein